MSTHAYGSPGCVHAPGTDLSAPMFEVVAEFNVYIVPPNIILGEN